MNHPVRRLISYMGSHAKLFLLVSIFVSLSALCNLFGTYMIRPIINGVAQQDASWIRNGLILMAGIFFVGVISALLYTQIMAVAAQKVVKDIRRDLFCAMQKYPIKIFDTYGNGELMSRLTNDVDTISDVLNNSLAMMIQSFIQVVGTLVLLFVLNWQLSLIVVVFYIIMFAYIEFSSQHSKRYFSSQQRFLGSLNRFIQERITGQKVIKVFSYEKKNLMEFDELNSSLRESNRKAQSFAQTMIPMVVSISYINYAIVAIVGGFMVLKGQSDVGALASYLVFVRQAAMPINQFTQQGNIILASLSGASRIFEMMDMKPEEDEGMISLAKKDGIWCWKHPRNQGFEYIPVKGDVVLDDICFGYDPKKMVLDHVYVHAAPGQTIAFVGATGAGKTTITNLINRFYEIQSGSIMVDGINTRLIKKDDLRKSMSVVLQDTHLFTGTIMDNIRYGKLDATDEECIAAAKLANAHSFIYRLPQGYDTMIYNDGSSLSQGQRQLIAIARAAVADPAILILDEATSSIDTRTEKIVQEGMDQLMEGRTVFVVAHRLSTVRRADQIVVLDHGQIKEVGSHEELLEKQGMYYQLYTGAFELS